METERSIGWIPKDYNDEEFARDKRYLRMRETDPFYRLTSSPLTYLVGGILFTGATLHFASSGDDTPTQNIDSFSSYFFGVAAGLNYLMSGFQAWCWHATKSVVKNYEKIKAVRSSQTKNE